jgi:hypothetical protein
MKKAPLVGAGGGAITGFLMGGPVGAAIGAGIGFLGGKRFGHENAMTPERKRIFEEALRSLKDPIQLRKLADVYESEGLPEEADLLRKRAMLRELPADQKAERKKAFREAMKVGKDGSEVTPEKIQTIEKLAAAFYSQGATGNAAALRQHAAGLKKMIGLNQ